MRAAELEIRGPDDEVRVKSEGNDQTVIIMESDLDEAAARRVLDYMSMLDGVIKSGVVDPRLVGALPGRDWTTFGEATASEFANEAANDPELREAIEHQGELMRQRAANTELAAAWSQRVIDRLALLNGALGREAPTQSQCATVGHGTAPFEAARSVTVGLSPFVGLTVRYDLDGRLWRWPRPTSLHIDLGACSISFEKPLAHESNSGQEESHIVFRDRHAGRVFLDRPLAEGSETICFFLMPHTLGVHGRTTRFPDGHGGITRRIELNGPGWEATLDLEDDERLLFDLGYFKLIAALADRPHVARMTVNGDRQSEFPRELLWAVLAQTVHADVRLLETQTESAGSVLAIEIPGERPKRPLAWWRARQYVAYEEIEATWKAALLLPESGDAFSRHHLRVAMHAIATADRQPIQKTLVDLYCVLDTLAKVHPGVPKTAIPKEEFKQTKAYQRKILKKARDASTDDAERVAISQVDAVIEKQQNHLGVAAKILKLLDECGITFDRDDPVTRNALEWRNWLSHDLTSLPVVEDGEKGATWTMMVAVKHRLLGWCHAVVGAMLGVPQPVEADWNAQTL